MTHLPFQDWLFEDTLDATQADQLHSHLETCDECRELQAAFGQVENSLRRAPLVQPAQDFVIRWQGKLELERSRLHKRQIRLGFAFGLGGVVVLLGLLAILLWPLLDSLDALGWAIVYQLYLGLLYFRQIAETFAILAKALAPALPLVLSIVALGLLTQAGVLWVVSYRYITNPRRIVI
jgi:predicted anti-sigma-YlaC factor YlaD